MVWYWYEIPLLIIFSCHFDSSKFCIPVNYEHCSARMGYFGPTWTLACRTLTRFLPRIVQHYLNGTLGRLNDARGRLKAVFGPFLGSLSHYPPVTPLPLGLKGPAVLLVHARPCLWPFVPFSMPLLHLDSRCSDSSACLGLLPFSFLS